MCLRALPLCPDTVRKMFEPPEGQAAYTYVFDLTGEIGRDRSPMVRPPSTSYSSVISNMDFLYLLQFHVEKTAKVAQLIGLEAARRKVMAYIRLQRPLYETSEKGSHDEKEVMKPLGFQGVWWHETLRILAAIEGSVFPTACYRPAVIQRLSI